jgi:hypothetical protein
VDEGDDGDEEKSPVMVVTFSSSFSLEAEPLEDSMSVSQSPTIYAFPFFFFVKLLVLAFFLLEELLFFILIFNFIIFLALEFVFLGLIALMSKMANFSTIVAIHLEDGLSLAREKLLP